ncbi:ABC transporter permease [Alteribacillus bidgolensis]|uniref:ABC-2 type transport system permease protein n=1 Tax=Alteribacillus bidgolensis TaxID=930129 RepID=A0A1G8QKK9_9BACI|nr:ABC transporter permease subunit [Alteribacillus bidgolensis]SDJ05133.1 ABC-2 type transport system permease protein [Alteribacillus bidgolensis]
MNISKFNRKKFILPSIGFYKEHREVTKYSFIFWAVVRKEFTDYLTSWRIIILLAIIALTCLGSLYTAVTAIQDAISQSEEAQSIAADSFLFLKLFTVSDGTLPPFTTFITFLGPLLGIALGFDAINSERNKGTLSRLMAQPIPRDYVLNAKFTSALLINVVLFFMLGLLVMGLGILIIGIPPTFEEFMRIILFLVISVAYVAFWLNVGILFSVQFRQPATSALAGIAIWIFFSVFYSMIISLIQKTMMPSAGSQQVQEAIAQYGFIQNLSRLSPSYLFNESTTILLTPSVRTLGPLSMEQRTGAIPSPLPLDQSLILIWPQLTSLIAITVVCFAISYVIFMKQEIRSK